MLNPVNKHTVLKQARNGKWEGYIAPSKVNAYHVADGWQCGLKLVIRSERNIVTNEYTYYAHFGEGNGPFLTRKLDDVLNEMLVYNCNSELGRRIRFWQ